MAPTDDTRTRARLAAVQMLESWRLAGVCHLPRRSILTMNAGHEGTQPIGTTHRPPSDSPTILGRTDEGDERRDEHNSQIESIAQIAGPTTVAETAAPEASQSTSTTEEPDLALKQRVAALAAMQIEVAACRRCEHLACTRIQTVFGVGNPNARVCFFGEAPGADEDRRGEPFVGRAGQLLTDIIERGMKLKRSDVYILNVLKCRPPENRQPTDDEILNCRDYFERQFQLIRPEFICCLGTTAMRALLETKQPIGRMRGNWYEYRGARVMVTYHPSYLLRNPPAKKETWADIQLLMREMGLPIEARV